MSTLRHTLDQLLFLQHIDSDRDKLNRQRPTVDSLNEITARVAVSQNALQASRAELAKMVGSLKDAELELAGIEKKIKDYEFKMRQGTVTNTREVMNFEKEFNQLNRQRSALDDKILALMESVDEKETVTASAEAKAQGAGQELKTAKTKFHNELARVESEIGRLNTERASTAKLIEDQVLLKRYESLRARPGNGGIAIAKTTDNTCGACHMQVGTVSITQAESGSQLTICENCGRIMA